MYRGLTSAKSSLLSNAQEIANQVLCLPIYPNLSNHDVKTVIDMIN